MNIMRQVESQDDFKFVIEELNKADIRYVVYFGTLLGFYRNQNFILHDDDIDLLIDINPESDKFKQLLKILENNDFEITRWEGEILTIKRLGCRIDFYIVTERLGRYTCNAYTFPKKFIKNIKNYEIFNIEVKIPNNTTECLVHLYGETWVTPISNFSASPKKLEYRIQLYLKSLIPGPAWNFLKKILKK